MRSPFSALLVGLTSFYLATAHPGPTPAPRLAGRQDTSGFPTSVPVQCQSQCSVVDAIANCSSTATDASCICSNNIGSELLDCINCGIMLGGVLEDQVQAAQSQLNQFVSGCDSAGQTISPLTIGATGEASPTTSTTPGYLSESTSSTTTSPTESSTPKNIAVKSRRIPGGFVGLIAGVVLGIVIVML